MLALVTNRDDLTADWLVLELETRGAEFVRLCTEDYPSAIGIELTPDAAVLELSDRTVSADEISSVWWRRSVAPIMPTARNVDHLAWARREALTAWFGFWGAVDGRWVNRSEANARADCKPVQLREARRLGLSVPPTLVTNNLETAREFQRQHGEIVCKSLSSGTVPAEGKERSLSTQVLGAETLDCLEELGPEPYLLQAFVDKIADVRVTVVGEKAFACRINKSGPL